MKKCLVLVCGVLIGLSSAQAEGVQAGDSCARGGGKIIVGHNGTPYCQSNRDMNWWTALDWCQQQGKQLIQYPADCMCSEEGCPVKACSNLTAVGNGQAWTSTPWQPGHAYYIRLHEGAVNGNGTDVKLTSHLSAVCK